MAPEASWPPDVSAESLVAAVAAVPAAVAAVAADVAVAAVPAVVAAVLAVAAVAAVLAETWKPGELETSRAGDLETCLLYTSPSPRDKRQSRMPSSA